MATERVPGYYYMRALKAHVFSLKTAFMANTMRDILGNVPKYDMVSTSYYGISKAELTNTYIRYT
ncbi:MAG: hypothetical protein F6K24_15305 [Okeania sp. SIO2D1]|nr:hypothetical protein [Okeania sp. SIO2D1]